MTQNQEWIENNSHGKRIIYGGFALDEGFILSFPIKFQAQDLWRHSFLIGRLNGTQFEKKDPKINKRSIKQ